MLAGIKAIEYYLPELILTNDELAVLYPSWTANKIYEKTGITTRHIATTSQTALDLGEMAAKKILDSSVIERHEIDCLIFASQSPDYKLPSSACILQDRLGLKKNIAAFDINLGCSAYIYALSVAKSFVVSQMARNVLIVTADTYSKYIHPMDKSTRTLFGDGAAATLVGDGGIQIGAFDFGTDGSGKDMFIINAGGARIPYSDETKKEIHDDDNVRTAEHIYMDGPGIFNFTIEEIPYSIEKVLQLESLSKNDISLYVLHQANRFMLEFLRKKMKIEKEKFYINLEDTGNTVSSSVPIALKRAWEEGKLQRGKVVLSGFGVGLSWGSVVLHVD